MKDHDYRHILLDAATLFDELVPLTLKTYMDEREGEGFQMGVEVLEDFIMSKWGDAITALAFAVNKKGRDCVLEPLECPSHVDFAERHGDRKSVV